MLHNQNKIEYIDTSDGDPGCMEDLMCWVVDVWFLQHAHHVLLLNIHTKMNCCVAWLVGIESHSVYRHINVHAMNISDKKYAVENVLNVYLKNI